MKRRNITPNNHHFTQNWYDTKNILKCQRPSTLWLELRPIICFCINLLYTAVDCGNATIYPNASPNSTYTLFMSNVSYECSKGFQWTNPKPPSSTCQANGTWSLLPSHCERTCLWIWLQLAKGLKRHPMPVKLNQCNYHDNDVIMVAMASQITSLIIVYSTVYSCADQRKHQSSVSLAFVWGFHREPVNSPHKWPVTRKFFSIWWRHHKKIIARYLDFQSVCVDFLHQRRPLAGVLVIMVSNCEK